MIILYESEKISSKNGNEFFSIDESLINHKNNKQIWLLDIINKATKEFRIEGVYNRDSAILETFIKKYVEKGNTIISDGWPGYNFLNSEKSGYSHITRIHQGGSFGYCLQSTSHIETVWNIINGKIKSIYHVIPGYHLMNFVKEIEYR